MMESRQLGHYQIIRELGSGGMATVYLAEDRKHSRQVALKVLKPELTASLGNDRFLREIQVIARLNHPHILPLLDSGEIFGTLYYTMPLVDGGSLRAWFDRVGQLYIREVVELAADLSGALDYAHLQGVIHRDIKPENILIYHGVPMLADFGIALATGEAERQRLTETGLSLGTPQYMSPEQISGTRDIDHRSDVYSLACVLYEAIVGEPPFTGPTAMAVLARQVSDPVRSITTVRPDLPEYWDRLITRALAKVPAERFESAGAFTRALGKSVSEESRPIDSTPVDTAKKIVAVLPFANLSVDPRNAWFAEGITDDIISQLSKINELKVISRTSTARYQGTDKSLRQIGAELGVEVILEGSTRRADDRVRILVQLIDASEDLLLWSETYDRELTDVFSIQSEVALRIAEELEAHLSPDARERIESQPTSDLAAYELYLLGRFHWNRRTEADIRKAIENFEEAIARDTQFALAHAGLADAYLFAGLGYAPIPPAEALPKAQASALEALELDPALPEAHSTYGFTTLMYDWDVDRAEASLEQAVSLNPNHAPAHQWLAWCRNARGRYAEGFESFERARSLDPQSVVLATESGWPFSYTGMHEQALERYQQALEIDPDYALAHYNVGMSLQALHRYDEAITAYDRSISLSGGMPLFKAFLSSCYAEAGMPEKARSILTDLLELSESVRGLALPIAFAFEALGEIDTALDWLDRAYVDREPFVLTLPMEHWLPFTSLRGHPRFRDIITGIGAARHDPQAERVKLELRIPQAEESVADQEPDIVDAQALVSIVILPFENMSPDPDQDYFCDGMTEEVISDLSQINGLRTISRSSAMTFKGAGKSATEIAGELGVRYVLEGSVRKAGNELRISAQLLDSDKEVHLWADKYDGSLDDVFIIQTSVAMSIVEALKLTLTPNEQSRIIERPIENVQAYDFYLRARQEMWRLTPDSFDRARQLLENGMDLVGDNEALLTGFGSLHFYLFNWGISLDDKHLRTAEEYADKVLRMAPEAHYGQVLKGLVCYKRGRIQQAVNHFKQAIDRHPNDPEACLWLAYMYGLSGKNAAAVPVIEKAIEIDPLTPINHGQLGMGPLLEGDPQTGLKHFTTMYNMEPDNIFYRYHYTRALIWNDRADEAFEIINRSLDEAPDHIYTMFMVFIMHAVQGDHEQATRSATADLQNYAKWDAQMSWVIAECYAMIGENQKALNWLENAINKGFINYPCLSEFDPFLENIRGEQRFNELMERVRSEWEKFEV
ncbi:tetratricopeptide repeat protein [Gemmatimonadota bacterium]